MNRPRFGQKMPLTINLDHDQVLFIALLSRALSSSPCNAILHLIEEARVRANGDDE